MGIHGAKANLYFALSDFEGSRAEGERLLDLARSVGDQASEAGALASMGWASLWAYDLDRGLEYSRQAIKAAGAKGLEEGGVLAITHAGTEKKTNSMGKKYEERLFTATYTPPKGGGAVSEDAALAALAGLVQN